VSQADQFGRRKAPPRWDIPERARSHTAIPGDGGLRRDGDRSYHLTSTMNLPRERRTRTFVPRGPLYQRPVFALRGFGFLARLAAARASRSLSRQSLAEIIPARAAFADRDNLTGYFREFFFRRASALRAFAVSRFCAARTFLPHRTISAWVIWPAFERRRAPFFFFFGRFTRAPF